MEQVNTIDRRQGRRCVRRRAAGGWRAGLAALAIAGLGSACLAAESISSLGAAFRPQVGADAPVAGNAQPTGANLAGLRVVVSSTSRSLASIDGQIVRVGDMVSGMRVTQINQQGVVLMGEGGVRERLTVYPSAVKRKRPVNAPRVSNGVRQ
jgi:hypothetical protein